MQNPGLNGFLGGVETVETVSGGAELPVTPLKRGVNERVERPADYGLSKEFIV